MKMMLLLFVAAPVGWASHHGDDALLEGFLFNQTEREASFFPPVPDIAGWANALFPLPNQATFSLVDYAGVIADFLGELEIVDDVYDYDEGEDVDDKKKEAKTKLSGSVTTMTRADGLITVKVALDVLGAIGFAQNIGDLNAAGFDFDAVDTIFGNKVATADEGIDTDPSILNGAPAARGTSRLRLSYTINPLTQSIFANIVDITRVITPFAPSELRIDYFSFFEDQALLLSQEFAYPEDLRDQELTDEQLEDAQNEAFSRAVGDVLDLDTLSVLGKDYYFPDYD